MVSTLLTFLEALPEPVIPFAFYQRCLDANQTAVLAKQVGPAVRPHRVRLPPLLTCLGRVGRCRALRWRCFGWQVASQLPLVHKHVFMYLTGLGLDILQQRRQTGVVGISKQDLGRHRAGRLVSSGPHVPAD